MTRYYWMAVTADKFELPIAVECTARELAEKIRLTLSGVNSMEQNKYKGYKSGKRVIKIEQEETDQSN